MRFKDKVVLITGASRGIGQATALAFAHEGAKVVVNCWQDSDRAIETRAEIIALGREAEFFRANVADADDVSAMVKAAVSAFGRIHVLVNNAGITQDRTTRKMTGDEWHSVLDVNLNGAFYCSQAMLPSMLETEPDEYGQRGAIVSVASVVGLMGDFGQVNYAASKAGIMGLTRSLAREVAGKEIRVNAVAPGFIETGILEAVPLEVKDKILAQTPMGRFGKPEEVAQAILFLASPTASFITGEVLNINGGHYMQ